MTRPWVYMFSMVLGRRRGSGSGRWEMGGLGRYPSGVQCTLNHCSLIFPVFAYPTLGLLIWFFIKFLFYINWMENEWKMIFIQFLLNLLFQFLFDFFSTEWKLNGYSTEWKKQMSRPNDLSENSLPINFESQDDVYFWETVDFVQFWAFQISKTWWTSWHKT